MSISAERGKDPQKYQSNPLQWLQGQAGNKLVEECGFLKKLYSIKALQDELEKASRG